jgi:hypothetical protein
MGNLLHNGKTVLLTESGSEVLHISELLFFQPAICAGAQNCFVVNGVKAPGG